MEERSDSREKLCPVLSEPHPEGNIQNELRGKGRSGGGEGSFVVGMEGEEGGGRRVGSSMLWSKNYLLCGREERNGNILWGEGGYSGIVCLCKALAFAEVYS